MLLHKINATLLTVVLTLIIVAVLVLLKVLFSDADGFEWGSVSDWFSTAGTFGTLAIAYAAYRKAPEWMAQKHYDIAYSIIEKAIFNDLPNIRSSSLHLKTRMLTISRSLKMSLNNNTSLPETIEDTIESTDIKVIEFHQECYSIINKLKAVNRTNYELSTYSEEIITLLQSTSNRYSRIYSTIYQLADEIRFEHTYDESKRTNDINGLQKLQNDTIKNNDAVSRQINTVFHENRPIKDFVIHKK